MIAGMHSRPTWANQHSRYLALYRYAQCTALRPWLRWKFPHINLLYKCFSQNSFTLVAFSNCTLIVVLRKSQMPKLFNEHKFVSSKYQHVLSAPLLDVAFGMSLAIGPGWKHCMIKTSPKNLCILIICSLRQNKSSIIFSIFW